MAVELSRREFLIAGAALAAVRAGAAAEPRPRLGPAVAVAALDRGGLRWFPGAAERLPVAGAVVLAGEPLSDPLALPLLAVGGDGRRQLCFALSGGSLRLVARPAGAQAAGIAHRSPAPRHLAADAPRPARGQVGDALLLGRPAEWLVYAWRSPGGEEYLLAHRTAPIVARAIGA